MVVTVWLMESWQLDTFLSLVPVATHCWDMHVGKEPLELLRIRWRGTAFVGFCWDLLVMRVREEGGLKRVLWGIE